MVSQRKQQYQNLSVSVGFGLQIISNAETNLDIYADALYMMGQKSSELENAIKQQKISIIREAENERQGGEWKCKTQNCGFNNRNILSAMVVPIGNKNRLVNIKEGLEQRCQVCKKGKYSQCPTCHFPNINRSRKCSFKYCQHAAQFDFKKQIKTISQERQRKLKGSRKFNDKIIQNVFRQGGIDKDGKDQIRRKLQQAFIKKMKLRQNKMLKMMEQRKNKIDKQIQDLIDKKQALELRKTMPKVKHLDEWITRLRERREEIEEKQQEQQELFQEKMPTMDDLLEPEAVIADDSFDIEDEDAYCDDEDLFIEMKSDEEYETLDEQVEDFIQSLNEKIAVQREQISNTKFGPADFSSEDVDDLDLQDDEDKEQRKRQNQQEFEAKCDDIYNQIDSHSED